MPGGFLHLGRTPQGKANRKLVMAAAKGTRPPNAGKGRPAGVPNKSTMAAKEAIALAAEGLGGTNRLIAWAQEDPLNERAFWSSIYPKLIPVTLAGDAANPLQLEVRTVRYVKPGG